MTSVLALTNRFVVRIDNAHKVPPLKYVLNFIFTDHGVQQIIRLVILKGEGNTMHYYLNCKCLHSKLLLKYTLKNNIVDIFQGQIIRVVKLNLLCSHAKRLKVNPI